MAFEEIDNEQYLYTSLKELGLTNLESKLYILSLKLGPVPISTLATHLGVSRPNVYKIINGLKKQNLASFYGKAKYARDFIVESPTTVLEMLRQKKETIEVLDSKIMHEMPNLLAQYQQGGKDTKIKVLKGREQYIKIFLQTTEELKENDSIEFFGSAEDFIALTGWDTEKKWIKKRLDKNIFVKSLVPKGSETILQTNQEKELREVRTYRGELPFKAAMELFGKKMILWQPKAPLAVLIEDEYLVAMFRSIFYALWEDSDQTRQ